MLIKIVLVEVTDGKSGTPPRQFRVGINPDHATERGVESDARFAVRSAEGLWSPRYHIKILSVTNGSDLKHGEVVDVG